MANVRELGSLGEDILKKALQAIGSEDNKPALSVNLYLNRNEFPVEGELTVAGRNRKVPVSAKALHIYADLAPLHNWAHPVRHFFYHYETGELIYSEYGNFPPDGFETSSEAYEPLHVPLIYSELPPPSSEPEMGQRFFLPLVEKWNWKLNEHGRAGRRYAILFSGNSNNRHLNDMEFLYRVLVDVYKYDPDDIVVLNFDGTLNYNGSPQPVGNWPGNNTSYKLNGRINGAGTLADFDKALTDISKKLKANDQLLIHTNNHGGQNDGYNQPWLCGYPNFSLVYKASDFGARLKLLPKFDSLIVSMEQCYSGAFMSPVLSGSTAKNTSFASAVPASMSSMGGPQFDPWALSWIAAFNGANPNGAPLSLPVSSNPSAKVAFDYSNAVHVPGDLPQYNDSPGGVGGTLHL